MFARILLRFWPTTFKNPVCWGFCIHCGQPSAKAAASPRDILHRTKARTTPCLIRGFMGFSFLERLGLFIAAGTRSFEKICEPCQDNFATAPRRGATSRKPRNYSVRNAFIGVIRVARWAGKKQARSDAAASIRL